MMIAFNQALYLACKLRVSHRLLVLMTAVLFFGIQVCFATSSLSHCLNAPPISLPPTKHKIYISNEKELQQAISNLRPSTTLILAPGKYYLTQTLYIKKEHVYLRGQNNDCQATQLIGPGMDNPDYGDVPYGIWSNAPHLILAHLTIQDIYHHSIHLASTAHAPIIYQCKLLNSGAQFIKSSARFYGQGVQEGQVLYSQIGYTQGPPKLNYKNQGTGYTNGIDVHGGINWQVKHNLFAYFHMPDHYDHLWNPTVLFWNGSKGTLTQNNRFIDVDRAIAYGLGRRKTRLGLSVPDHIGGQITNNMVSLGQGLFTPNRQKDSDASILVWNSPDTLVAHNTILNQGNHKFAIEARYSTTGVRIINNLSDAPSRFRGTFLSHQPNTPLIEHNKSFKTVTLFINPQSGDLHLNHMAAELYNSLKVPALKAVPKDYDGKERPRTLTFSGADEP